MRKFVLTVFGLPHVMGYLAARSGEKHPAPLGLVGLMDATVEMGLAGVEFPLPSGLEDVQPLREELAARNLALVTDYIPILESSPEAFQDYLRLSAALGARVVRATFSRILCGERRNLAGGWEAHLEAIAQRLREVLPYAEDLGVCIAMENHQDATSEDMLRLAEMVDHSPSYGVTLDAGNPLAVGEEPVEAARRLAPIIRHLHLKDYTIHFAPEGYRLVRCPAGQGVVDFPRILEIVEANGHELLPGIEIAAQQTRTIPILDPGWWAAYPPTPAASLIGALQILWKHGHPMDEPYSSAWERGENSAAVSEEEWQVVRKSAWYFQEISASASL